jgi:hypothetical protein
MKKLFIGLGIVAFLSGLAFGVLHLLQPSPEVLATKTKPQAEPQIEKTVDSNQAPLPTVAPEDNLKDSADNMSIEKSDSQIAEAIKKIMTKEEILAHFQIEDFIHKIVVTVNNMSGPNLPSRYSPFIPLTNQFQITQMGEKSVLGKSNFERFDSFIVLAESLYPVALIKVYTRFYPVFQKNFEDLGEKGSFNSRLLEVVKELLATPMKKEPIELIESNRTYEFADPDLESLAAGQKILIRMGTENGLRIKTVLRTYIPLLTNLKK